MSEIEERVTEVAPASPADLAASEPDTLVGATLQDTYTITRFMAEGGMGRVYEAQHTRISTKRFAIKVLLSELKHSICLLYTSPSPRDISGSRMPASA